MAREKTIEDLLKENVHYTKKQDVLLDIHVGNPLRRITEILEEIKNQKAFSFTLKGSLGLAGVAVIIGTFGLLGGTKALCDKGVQTKTGNLRQLAYLENSKPTILDAIPFLSDYINHPVTQRIVLNNGSSITHVTFTKTVSALPYLSQNVLVTGDFDSCSNTLSVSDTTGIETGN